MTDGHYVHLSEESNWPDWEKAAEDDLQKLLRELRTKIMRAQTSHFWCVFAPESADPFDWHRYVIQWMESDRTTAAKRQKKRQWRRFRKMITTA